MFVITSRWRGRSFCYDGHAFAPCKDDGTRPDNTLGFTREKEAARIAAHLRTLPYWHPLLDDPSSIKVENFVH
jgi:hypothetical protein